MRVWLSGPRIWGIRPGISFRPDELFRSAPRAGQLPRRRAERAFVYVIRGNHDLVKIGVTTRPSERLSQLQASSSSRLEFAYLAAVPSSGFAVEREAHRILADHRHGGEWFDVTPETAVASIAVAAHRLGEPLASGDPRLAHVAVRMAMADERDPVSWLGSAALAVLKFIAAIPVALMTGLSLYMLAIIIKDAI